MSNLPSFHPDGETSGPSYHVGPIPWDQFKAELLALYEPPLRARATYRQMRRVLGLAAALGVQSTADLTPALIARFVAARPPEESPNTTYSLVAVLRVACNYAAMQGYCRVSPFQVRKKWVRRVAPRPRKHHSREEIARVLATMERDIRRKTGWARWRARRLYALTSLVAYTGLRRNEALFLRVEDICLEERMLFIRARHGSHGNLLKTEASAQPVPIPDALVTILRDWLPHLALPEKPYKSHRPVPDRLTRPASNPEGTPDPGWCFPNSRRTGPWVGGSPGHKPLHRLKAVGQRAGVEGFTFLSLRHSWATHAEYWGLSDAMIQRVLRHTTTRTQWHYRHADADNMREKVKGLGFGNVVAALESRPTSPAPSPAVPPAKIPAPRPDGPHPNAPFKLDPGAIAEMRRLRAEGWSYAALRLRFNVAKSTLSYWLASGPPEDDPR